MCACCGYEFSGRESVMPDSPSRPRRGFFSIVIDFFRWLFQPPEAPVSTAGVRAWWSSRRTFYNLVVGLLAAPLILLAFLALWAGGDGFPYFLMIYLAVLICANLAYAAGSVVDRVVRFFRPTLTRYFSLILFHGGLVFSVLALMAGPFLMLGSLLLTLGMGTGTWEDDKRNWQRAFGREQPKDITVVHSWYCQTPHFTHESQYFFELAPNEVLRRTYSDPERVLLVTPEAGSLQQSFDSFPFMNQPAWFAPKPLTAYQIFQGKAPNDNFFLFVDRETDAIFITSRIGM